MGISILDDEPRHPILRFMSRTEVAHYLGLTSILSLANITLPAHDAQISDRKGWTAQTIDQWAARIVLGFETVDIHTWRIAASKFDKAAALHALGDQPRSEPQREALNFMGRNDIADWLQLKSVNSLTGVTLPPHDVEIGNRRGWTEATIAEWDRGRPGSGRRGARFGMKRAGTDAHS